jgi:hypothetical protein
MALRVVGFAEVSVTGNYARRPPRARDRILTYEARRS